MNDFQMAMSAEVQELLVSIVHEMIEKFGITRAEAIARVNEHWHDRSMASAKELILHEDETFWAPFIYYGGRVPEWENGEDSPNETPVPRPIPDSRYWTVTE